MAKPKNGHADPPATKPDASDAESSLPKEDAPPAASAPSQAIAKAPETALASLADKLGENNSPLFLAKYKERIASVTSELPDKMTANRIIDNLPEEYADAVASIIRRSIGKRKGIYADDDRPELPELRIFHGPGNDPNRPENMVPGQYYLTTKETVGKQFIGTVLAVYKGRTMWGDRDAGENTRMPVCQSMDREVGSSFGRCDVCPNKPWRDGKQQRCSDDVVAYMLSRDLKEIVVVRFAKTSQGAGQQLIKFVRRTEANWSKWYSITAEATVNQNDKTQRYYVMKASPLEGEEKDIYVPDALHDFCSMMCTLLEANTVLPGIAHTYRQSKDLLTGAAAQPATKGAGSADLMKDGDNPDYGEMPDAPEGTTNV
jgi:hypothetical protein